METPSATDVADAVDTVGLCQVCWTEGWFHVQSLSWNPVHSLSWNLETAVLHIRHALGACKLWRMLC